MVKWRLPQLERECAFRRGLNVLESTEPLRVRMQLDWTETAETECSYRTVPFLRHGKGCDWLIVNGSM